VWLASALINGRIRNRAGTYVGKIEDLVVATQAGNIEYVIVSFGGVAENSNKLYAIPWTSANVSPSLDYILLDIDPQTLDRAPSFDRNAWPEMADAGWRRRIRDHYGPVARQPGQRAAIVEHETPAVTPTRTVERRRRVSGLAVIVLACLVVAVALVGFLVSTRGWEQAKQDVQGYVEGAAYAAKETSHDAALTTRVKTALSLSKRIPPGQNINVDSEGDVVTLRGEVPSESVRDLAEAITRDVPGVREVHNHLFALNQNH
jgi:sporulation protein YlmC with PRC-barrel domain